MGQRAFLAEFDAALHEAFSDIGASDEGMYLRPGAAPGESPVPCRIYVTRDIATIGDLRQSVAGRVEVAYVLSAGFVPEQHGTLLVDGDKYENTKPVSDDGSLSRWQVRRVAA